MTEVIDLSQVSIAAVELVYIYDIYVSQRWMSAQPHFVKRSQSSHDQKRKREAKMISYFSDSTTVCESEDDNNQIEKYVRLLVPKIPAAN